MKRVYIMAHTEARQRAVQAVKDAPEGYAVTVSRCIDKLYTNTVQSLKISEPAKCIQHIAGSNQSDRERVIMAETNHTCIYCGFDYYNKSSASTYCSLACFRANRSQTKHGEASVKGRFEKHFIVTPGCWLWQSLKTSKGYGRLHCFGSMNLAHRVSYQLYVGKVADDICVLHRCDVPGCVNPDHLFLGTVADNNQDKSQKGRAPRGETHPLSKFTESQISSIYHDDRPYRLIVNDFGISKPHISGIKSGKFWTHVTGQLHE